jgi:hypothetical protein
VLPSRILQRLQLGVENGPLDTALAHLFCELLFRDHPQEGWRGERASHATAAWEARPT